MSSVAVRAATWVYDKIMIENQKEHIEIKETFTDGLEMKFTAY